MPTEQQRNKRLEKAQLRVLFTVPFFAPGVAKLPVVWDPHIPTACTDGNQIRWNPDWFDSLPDPVLPTVLCHEVAHPLLGHLWRIPGGADMETWNIAADHAVNNMLKQFGEQVVAKRLADPFPMPDGNICCDPKYANMSEEAIFAELVKNQPPGGGGNRAGRSGGSSTPQRGGKGTPAATQGSGQGGKTQGQTPGRQPFGEFELPRGTPEQRKRGKTDWQNTLLQSVAASQGRGDMPGYISRIVDEIMHPKVPWADLVRVWLAEKAEDDWNWQKPNPFYDDTGFMLPSLDSERMGKAVFATDTSGSIDHKVLAQFQAEKQQFLDDMKPESLIDIYCDAAITSEKEYRTGEQIGKDAPGGGGTSFVPVFERLKELPMKPKLVVYLTDLDGEFPSEEPDYPVLWVKYGGLNRKAPFGDVVEVE